jgi:hypothetical protein
VDGRHDPDARCHVAAMLVLAERLVGFFTGTAPPTFNQR